MATQCKQEKWENAYLLKRLLATQLYMHFTFSIKDPLVTSLK